MKAVWIIFLGGGLGSVCRYLVNRWVTGIVTSAFPYGTFLVNITGCFLIGFLVFYSAKFGTYSLNWRLFLVTGICGGYTTFSSFSFENVQLISDHQLFTAILYAFGSIVLGFLATYMGILTARSF
ncbi:fluoride efflux transporter CrcB [Mucilaginibacter sp. HC2]|uniref:fluoride efflux transporter CrcB n=1 Tax=Mucilaginibacter inviolabilis TaxID=2714892 RepID=UPI00140B68BF|nr:fluoride efflux transporter CrcB [Mucilaginibacter inviolabilis]NHA02685.1 fluoride efflux transporter CrcB [Mucilaginibacter inviolabilis]